MKPAMVDGWRRLYGAGAAFARLAPWQWMFDRDVFGVKEPATGQIAWCAVLGARDEVLGLSVYWGEAGFATWETMQSGEFDRREIGSSIDGLLFSMDDREQMEPHDLATIRSLGLRFRGRRAWPSFRSLRPGHALWHLEDDEILAFAAILEQASDVCTRHCRTEDPLLLAGDGGRLLVRVRDGDLWRDTWAARPHWVAPKPVPPQINAEALRPILAQCKPAVTRWEFGNMPLRTVIEEPGKRPFYPRATLVVDASSGLVLHFGLGGGQFKAEDVQAELLKALEATRTIPAKIAVRGGEVLACLKPLAKAIGARIEEAADLPMLDEALDGMDSHLD